MQLIIDIDKETYKMCKQLLGDADGIERAIANGIPVSKTGGYVEIRNEIQPDGEWIIVKDDKWGDNVKCPFCGKELAGTDLNFCCKCGAKLIGSEKMNGGSNNE